MITTEQTQRLTHEKRYALIKFAKKPSQTLVYLKDVKCCLNVVFSKCIV